MNVQKELERHIEPVVVLSTSHLSEATKHWLTTDFARRDGLMAGMDWEYGWMVFTGNWAAEGVPEDLQNILKVCNDHNYSWVRFDCDALESLAFPTAS